MSQWEITFEEIHRNGAMILALRNHEMYTGDAYLAKEGMQVAGGGTFLGPTRAGRHTAMVRDARGHWTQRIREQRQQQLVHELPRCVVLEVCLELVRRFDGQVGPEELDQWTDIAKRMCLPQQEGTHIRLQQDGFLAKDLMPAAELPEEVRPINQVWSWDRILRSCFIKQADVLQGFYFFPDDFSAEELRDNFAVYEPMTVHESSLSPCVHGILASRLGRKEKALEMYLRTSRLDLDDYNAEAYQGCTSLQWRAWMSVVEGFGGFRVVDGVPTFQTMLPEEWTSFAFKLPFRGRTLEVSVHADGADVALFRAKPVGGINGGRWRWIESIGPRAVGHSGDLKDELVTHDVGKALS